MAGLIVKRRATKAKKSNLDNSFDVVSVGRPAHDTFLSGKIFSPLCSHGSCYEHIPLGLKLAVDEVSVSYGGNALNAAVTFARQGLSVSLLAQFGEDLISQDALKLLEEEGVSDFTTLVDKEAKIAQSTILISPEGERTTLTYRGSQIDHKSLLAVLSTIETRWLYVSSLNSIELLEGVLRFAEINQIKVAFNPGGIELEEIETVKELLPLVEVLILNKQEAGLFFGNLEHLALCKAATKYVSIAIVTDGPNGALAYDGSVDYSEPISAEVKVVDRNGAGDAFASGVVSALAWGQDLKQALTLGSENSTSVVQHFGAQTGIMKRK